MLGVNTGGCPGAQHFSYSGPTSSGPTSTAASLASALLVVLLVVLLAASPGDAQPANPEQLPQVNVPAPKSTPKRRAKSSGPPARVAAPPAPATNAQPGTGTLVSTPLNTGA